MARWRCFVALGLWVALASAGFGQSLQFTNASTAPVSEYLLGTDSIFVLLSDADANLTTGPANDVVNLDFLDIPGRDTESSIQLTETSTPGTFFGPVGGFPLAFSSFSLNNGTLEAKHGDSLQAIYNPKSLNVTVTLRKTPTTSSLRILDASLADQTLVFLNLETTTFEVQDEDQDRDPDVVDSVQATASVAPGGDLETFTLVETAVSSGVFRVTTAPISGTANLADGVIQGASGSTLTAGYTDPDGDETTVADSAQLVQITNSSTEITDSAGTPRLFQGLPSSDLFITVMDADQNLDAFTQETVQVTVNTAITGDNLTVILNETTNNSGIFRNAIGVSVVQTGIPNLSNNILETDHGANVTASYSDVSRPADTSQDTLQAEVTPSSSSVQFLDSGSSVVAFIQAPGDLFVRVLDSDQNRSASTVETLNINLTTTGIVGGDVQNVVLTETGLNTAIFTAGPIPLVRSATPVGANGTLEVLQGDQITGTYTDPVNGTETAQAIVAVNVVTTASVAFVRSSSAPTGSTFEVGDGIVVEVNDPDQNVDPAVVETIASAVVVSFDGTGDSEAVALLTETGPNTSVFRSDGSLISAVSASVLGNGILDLSVPATIRVSYTDPGEPTDTATNTGLVTANEGTAVVQFSDSAGNPDTVFFIDQELVFVTVTDSDENTDSTTAQSFTLNLVETGTGDTETITVTEVGVNSGVFRNSVGIASIVQPVVPENGRLEAGDLSVLIANYLDNESNQLVSASATMRVTQVNSSTALTDAGGAIQATYRIGTDPIFVSVTDPDENFQANVADTLSGVVVLNNLTNGDVETLDVTETGGATGVFRSAGVLSSLPSGPITTGDGILQASDGDLIQAVYTDNDTGTDISQATAVMQFLSGSEIRLTDINGTTASQFPIGSPTDGIFITVTDNDENQDPTIQESVLVNLRHVPSTTGESIINVALTETTASSGVFRNTTAILAEVALPIVDTIFQTFDGAQIQAEYTDPNDATDSTTSNLAVMKNVATTATVVIGANPYNLGQKQSFRIGVEVAHVTVVDLDQDLSPLTVDTIQVDVVDLSTGDSVPLTLVESTPDSNGVFSNQSPLNFEIAPNTADQILQTAHNADFTANYTDPTPGDASLTFDSATALLDFTGQSLTLTDGNGNPVNPFLVGIDPVFITVFDPDENTNGSSQEVSGIVTLSSVVLGDFEELSLRETSISSDAFRSTPGIPIQFAPAPIPNNGVLEVQAAGEQIQGSYFDARAPGIGGVATGFSFVDLPPSGSVTRFTDNLGNVQATFTIGAGDIFITVVDSDRNIDNSVQDTMIVTLTADVTNDIEENILLTETGITTGIFRNATGFPSDIDLTAANDGTLQVAGSSTLTAFYRDSFTPSDTSTSTATVVVPQTSAVQVRITTTPTGFPGSISPATTAFIDADLLFVFVEDLDSNTDPTRIETIPAQLRTSGNPFDTVNITLIEDGVNSRFFLNNAASLLPSNVTTPATGVPTIVDPILAGDHVLQTFHGDIVTATYTDPDAATDTLSTTVEMRINEVSARAFFSDGAGTTRTTFPIDPAGAVDFVFVTVVDPDENLNASTQETLIVTLTDAITGDQETLVLTETGPDTDTFRNVVGLDSLLSPATTSDGVLQTGDLSTITALYQDDETASDQVSAIATMVVQQQASAIRFVDSNFNDASTYRMTTLTSELIFLVLDDPDENKDPTQPDQVDVVLQSDFNGDQVIVTLTETSATSGFFQSTTGVAVVAGCDPIPDNLLQAADGQTIRAVYTDPDDVLDREFDLATVFNLPTFSAGALAWTSSPSVATPITTFLIRGAPLFARLDDADENQDPCTIESLTLAATVSSSTDQESVVLTETGTNTGIFVGPVGGLPTDVEIATPQNGTLEVNHPAQAILTYVDNDNLSDQATATVNSVMFEAGSSCRFLADLSGTAQSGPYGIGRDLVFVEIQDEDQDLNVTIQDSISVTLVTTGGLDTLTLNLIETAAHTGVFRNSLPVGTNTTAGIPSQLALPLTTDSTLQAADGEGLTLNYIDPTDPTDVCTSTSSFEVVPTTSVTEFTDAGGNPRGFYSILFDDVFVTVTDADQNRDPFLPESVSVQVRTLFPAPANLDIESLVLTETTSGSGVFRNTTNPLPLEVGSALVGDGRLQSGDNLDIEVTYIDPDDAGDTSTSTARTFVASTNSNVIFTDENLGSPQFEFFVGGTDLFVEVTDSDENISGTSTQSVVVTITVTATGDTESFVLSEANDFGAGVVAATDSSIFRNLTAIQSVVDQTAVPGNGILEVVDDARLVATYQDDDFPQDRSQNVQDVRMRVAQQGATLRLLDVNLIPRTEYLVINDLIVVEVTDPDENGNPSVAETVLVTIDTFAQAFDRETFVATEIAANSGIFRTNGIPTNRLEPPNLGVSDNGIVEAVGDNPGGLGEDTFTVFYRDDDDGTDQAQASATITTQVGAILAFTDAAQTGKTTYTIGTERIFLRVVDSDENRDRSQPDTVIVTVTDFGTGDFEPVTLTETGPDTGVFFNPAGLVTSFDLTDIPGDQVLQTGDPSDATVQAEYLDPNDPLDNLFAQAELVPLDPNDRDGDGIPNQVETDNGLDPNDPSDATQDNDLDGRDNRTELIVDFTDPNDDRDNAPIPVITPLNVTLDPGVVRLDGSGSSDPTTRPPNIGIVAYRWSQVGTTPAVVQFSSTTQVNPFFVARAAGVYTIQLTVIDADGASRSGTSQITIRDLPPVADPGPGGSAKTFSTGVLSQAFQLDGSKSSDGNLQSLTYAWTAGPGNEVGLITFDDPSLAKPKIVQVGSTGRAVVRLTVTDTSFQSTSKDLVVLIHDVDDVPPFRNHVPTAYAGPDQVILAGPGVTAQLRGSLSSDADGDALSLAAPPVLSDLGWVYLSGPPGASVVAPTSLDTQATGFTQVGIYTFGLRVRDEHAGGFGTAISAQDTVNLIAQTPTNNIPSADAGGSYLFTPLTRVRLDGSASSDADPGDSLSFAWTQVRGLSTPLEDASVAQPFVTFTQPGVYEYELRVTDVIGNTSLPAKAVIRVGTTGNTPPVANAGNDQIVGLGTPVILDGSLSSDAEGLPLTHTWVQTQGTQIALSSRNAVSPSFTPPQGGTYVFELTVSDGTHCSVVDSVTISVDPPLANAGPDQSLFLAQGNGAIAVQLDGSGSNDPTPGPAALTFSWTQVSGPTVSLVGPNTVAPSFTATVAGTYIFQLVVDDGQALSPVQDFNNASDSLVKIFVAASGDTTPVARAGSDQFVAAGGLVTLDGNGSSDADGDSLIYLWTQLVGPAVTLNPSTRVVAPTFFPPIGGTAYTFRLSVTDPSGKTSTDDVTIFATGGQVGGGGGNPTADPGTSGGTVAPGGDGGGGGGCRASPLYLKGDWRDHQGQILLNLLMLLFPLLYALKLRLLERERVPVSARWGKVQRCQRIASREDFVP